MKQFNFKDSTTLEDLFSFADFSNCYVTLAFPYTFLKTLNFKHMWFIVYLLINCLSPLTSYIRLYDTYTLKNNKPQYRIIFEINNNNIEVDREIRRLKSLDEYKQAQPILSITEDKEARLKQE